MHMSAEIVLAMTVTEAFTIVERLVRANAEKYGDAITDRRIEQRVSRIIRTAVAESKQEVSK